MDCVCDLDRLDSQSPRPALSQTKPRFDPVMNLTVCLRLGMMLAMLSPGLPASAAEAATNSTVTTTNSVAAIEKTLARARAIAEKMETNGFRTNATGHALVSFAMLSGFKCDTYMEIEPPLRFPVVKLRDPIPDYVRPLHARKVSVTGFMLPLRTTAKGCTDFLLVRDQASCCFGAAPKMNHWIHVTAPEPGLRVMTGRPITVLGTLRIGPFVEDGSVTSIYEMAGDKLELPDLR
jgi:hypothetical protein